MVAPTPNSPADKAGVNPQDLLLAIDGKPTKGLSLYEASDLLQGEAGSSVTLTLQPKGQTSSKDVKLVRCAGLTR